VHSLVKRIWYQHPFTALKPSAHHNHPMRKFKSTYCADKCPSPVVCDECGHPNFWKAQGRIPKLNVTFLPSSSTALLKGERKCSNVRHETSGNWKQTKETACFKMYQQQCRRGREERPVQITGAQLYVAYVVSFSVVSLIVDCTCQLFHTFPKSLCNWQSVFPIWCKDLLASPPLLGGGRGQFFLRGPEQALEGTDQQRVIDNGWQLHRILC
jgi:hypothetical protein